jgi:PAS domain S-box-containing protein
LTLILIKIKIPFMTSSEELAKRHAEERVRNLNRMYSVLSAVNHLIIRATGRQALFQDTCRILVDKGLFRMAWIGILDETTRAIKPVACTGCEEGSLKNIIISVDDVPAGEGPTGKAFRTAEHFINNDTEHNPAMLPWRDEALRRGYLSSAAFPLIYENRSIGVITVYSGETGFFNDEEVRLMDELAADISYSIWSMEREELRKQAEQEARELGEKLRTLVEDALACVYIIQDERYIYVNNMLSALLGYSKEELLGSRSIIELIHPDDRPMVMENIRKRMDGEADTFHYELRMLKKDGEAIFFEVHSSYTVYLGKPSIIGTAIDITERKRSEKQRADFYAMVTHDLKSPLTSILGYSEIIQLKPGDTDKDILEMVAVIENSGTKLLRMVEDFLAVSRLESGVISLKKAPLELAPLLVDIQSGFEAQARKKNLDLKVEAEYGMSVSLDSAYFEMAMGNLIQNAINYTPVNGVITVKAEKSHGQVFVSVSDTGLGIPPEYQDRIFDKYYRVPGSVGKGNGLGLSTVKTIAEVHGGRVELISQAGQGSSFKLILPASP